MTLEEMVKELSQNGFWVIEPKYVPIARRRLEWVKQLVEMESK